MSRTPTSVPEYVPEDVTGRHDGEELARARAARSTEERIARLETKHDSLARIVSDVRVAVGEIGGKLDILVGHARHQQAEEQRTERTRLTSRAKVIVGVASALAAAAGAIGAALAGGCS